MISTFPEIQTLVLPSEKNLKKISLFWTGFTIYTAAYTVSYAGLLSDNFWNPVQALGLLLCIFAAAHLIHFKIENPYLGVVYSVYFIWVIFILMRGFAINFSFLKAMFFDAWTGMLLYFVPLFLLFHKSLYFLRNLFKVIIVLGAIYLIYDILFLKIILDNDTDSLLSKTLIEYFSKTLSIPCGFLLLTYVYHTNKTRLFALLVLIVTLTVALIRARRGLIFMCAGPLIFFYFSYVYENRRSVLKILFSFLLFSGIAIYGTKMYNKNKEGLFSLITERAEVDTRTDVEECFYDDMNTKDWIIGRGVAGQYYCPGAEYNDYLIYRTQIETDYLNIILKGGLVNLILLLLIAIPAIFKGLFFSKNMLSRASAVWILLWLINLYPSTVTTFTLNYILVWISIGICYSKTIRNLLDTDIKQILSENLDSESRL